MGKFLLGAAVAVVGMLIATEDICVCRRRYGETTEELKDRVLRESKKGYFTQKYFSKDVIDKTDTSADDSDKEATK